MIRKDLWKFIKASAQTVVFPSSPINVGNVLSYLISRWLSLSPWVWSVCIGAAVESLQVWSLLRQGFSSWHSWLLSLYCLCVPPFGIYPHFTGISLHQTSLSGIIAKEMLEKMCFSWPLSSPLRRGTQIKNNPYLSFCNILTLKRTNERQISSSIVMMKAIRRF